MAFTDKQIQGSTPIKEFPGKYNGLIEELENQLRIKNDQINDLQQQINNLRNALSSSLDYIRSYCINGVDQLGDKITSIENRIEVIENEIDNKTDE